MEILEGLWNTHLYYKGMRVNLLGVPRPWKQNTASFQSTVYRLRKNRLIDLKHDKWFITESGKKYLLKRRKLLPQFDSPFKKTSPKNLLLMFDIPKEKESERKWFRLHLKKFNYRMIQKSVWVGPSPLPEEFVSYLKKIKLSPCIKTFKLAKPYQIDKVK